ncbi:peptidoglycan/LPS O-acetylase OafA/YrhL [Mucilaginibacter yixingensis]|uniref:Peptidoglycan/LPS O-acetylase OafA/YrhL n=1 Tax=Mucilaginibacter yixingensis TaxID=1295612 RepID=A0A2T5JC82_9SPHI|nr:acyltransferase [Mucilaginibacter yixingensis]PTQ99366.1 peptidoglycan/LPS O-acetylase OafA/YrhL [Mucilaginibacter yixingensis]
MIIAKAPVVKKGIDRNLEALRGFAALVVVFNHIEALHKAFDANFLPTLTIVLAPNGHLFVLVFFVLSGYVIGISHQEPMRGPVIGSYIKKRLLRIYPIYIIATLFALLITHYSFTGWDIACNFLMLQTLLAYPIFENGPTWSLHYEMVYYGIFIPISRFRVSPLLILGISLVLALGSAGIFSAYFLGLSYWISGLCIARYFKNKSDGVAYNKLLSLLFLLLCLDQVLSRAGMPNLVKHLQYQLPVNHLFDWYHLQSPLLGSTRDLFFLPFYVFAVMIFAGINWRYERQCFGLINAIIASAITVSVNAMLDGHKANMGAYFIAIGYYLLFLLFWLVEGGWLALVSKPVIRFGSWIGGISYALYIVHAPILFVIGRFTFSDQVVTNYVIKVILLLSISTGFAWLLEKWFQPRIKQLLNRA